MGLLSGLQRRSTGPVPEARIRLTSSRGMLGLGGLAARPLCDWSPHWNMEVGIAAPSGRVAPGK